MRYRAVIPGMLGDDPFAAGEILELGDEATSWVEQMLLQVCSDQTVAADHSPLPGVLPTQPQPQADPAPAPPAVAESPPDAPLPGRKGKAASPEPPPPATPETAPDEED